MAKPLKVILAGTPEFALPCFEAIAQSEHQILGVWTQPDRPAGRGRHLQASPVKEWAQAKHYPIYQPEKLRDEQSQQSIAILKPDVMVVIAYGLILPQAVLDMPKLGCINVHASILPRWRGASPIQQAILAGDSHSGVTIMKMDAGMDTGPSFLKVSCAIDNHDSAASLHDKLSEMAVSPLLETLQMLAENKAEPTQQPDEGVTYAPKITKADAQIDWHDTAWQVDCQVRAFFPWPIAFTNVSKDVRLRIISGEPVDIDSDAKPGEIIQLDKQGMIVACGKNAYRVEQFQFPGGKVLSVANWIAGSKMDLAVGQQLLSDV